MSVLIDTAAPATTTKSERDAKLDALRERLDDAVAALVTGEDWRRAMEFAARFRSRSWRNVCLIWAQHLAAYETGQTDAPTPTYVAGFNQWKALGRHVKKGVHGYQIFAPVTARFASSTPSDASSWQRLPKGARPGPGEVVRSQMIGTRLAYVWDVSGTEGADLPAQPEPPRLLRGQAPHGLWDGLAAQVQARGFHLLTAATAAEIGGANGLTNYTARTVHVRADMDDAQRVKTLCHELGHVIDEPAARDAAAHRGIAEVTAESVALMVSSAHNLDTSDYTVPYVAGWATSVPGRSPLDVVHSTAERVRSIALQILDGLDTAKTGDGQPPREDAA